MCDNTVREGDVFIYCGPHTFYNPAQKFNRDLTIAILNQYLRDKPKAKIFEAMSATGIRGIRFIKELQQKCSIYMNDINKEAIFQIEQNLILNDIKSKSSAIYKTDCEQCSYSHRQPGCLKNSIHSNPLFTKSINSNQDKLRIESTTEQTNNHFAAKNKIVGFLQDSEFIFGNKEIVLSNNDCNAELFKYKNKLDVIDIDPFGPCVPFVDSALINIKDGGLLCLTSTDTSVLCSIPKKCYRKYNVMIRPNDSCKELALRTLLSSIIQSANKQDKSVYPIVSCSVDFYIRVFCIIKNKSPQNNMKILSYYLTCKCGNYIRIPSYTAGIETNQKICEICDKSMFLVGPYYNGPLHDASFISNIPYDLYDTRTKLFLKIFQNELSTFSYFHIPSISKHTRTSCIPMTDIMSAILNCGFRVSITHCKENSIKTDAPVYFLFYIALLYKKIKLTNKDIYDKTHTPCTKKMIESDNDSSKNSFRTNFLENESKSNEPDEKNHESSKFFSPFQKELFDRLKILCQHIKKIRNTCIFTDNPKTNDIALKKLKIGMINSKKGPLSRPRPGNSI